MSRNYKTVQNTPSKHWTSTDFWKTSSWEENLMNARKRKNIEADGQLRLIDIGDPVVKRKKRTSVKLESKTW